MKIRKNEKMLCVRITPGNYALLKQWAEIHDTSMGEVVNSLVEEHQAAQSISKPSNTPVVHVCGSR